jgi:hypothetical protein
MSETLYTLVNSEFDFSWNGQVYRIRKANLDKAVQYQKKAKELGDAKDPSADIKLAAYCIYIVLKDKDASITEQSVIENTPADIDVIECLTNLGFISPKRMEAVNKIREVIEKKATS